MGHVVAVVGLRREADIVGAQGARVAIGGGDNGRLRLDLRRLAAEAGGLISIGIAGGLDPALKPGDAVIGLSVVTAGGRYDADAGWIATLQARLPAAHSGLVHGGDRIVQSTAGKAALWAEHGAVVADMESHVAAKVAAECGLPFAVLRFVCDPAARALPPAALVGMKPDGGVNIGAVLRSVAADPRQIPALIRTGRDADAAFGALLSGCHALGPTLGLADVQGVQLA